jgi:hypothetical protein
LNSVQLKTTDADLVWTYNWSNDIPNGVTLLSVVNVMPSGLTVTSEQVDAANKLSTVQISGGTHGQRYYVKALATLSEGEDVPAGFVLRVLDGA